MEEYFQALTIPLAVGICLESILLAVACFVSLAPDWMRVLCKTFTAQDEATTSDIPGNPHVMDFTMISALRTLPEPNNFNMVLTKVPYNRGELIIEGYMPPARMFSVSAYKAGSSVPESEKLTNNFSSLHKSHYYRVLLTKTPEKYSSDKEGFDIVLPTHDWTHGMVVVRNYLVPSGMAVFTPLIRDRKTSEIIRKPTRVVSGAPNLHYMLRDTLIESSGRVLSTFLLATGINYAFLRCCALEYLFWPSTILLATSTTFLVSFIFFLLYQIGKRRIEEIFHKGTPEYHTVKLVDVENKAHDSAPSKLHRYYMTRYNVPEGYELVVKFSIQKSGQEYWSWVCYNEFGLPLPNMVFDETAIHDPDSTEHVHHITLYLAHRGHSSIKTNASQLLPAFHGQGRRNEIDVSLAPKGNVLYRLVHPVNDEVVAFAKPTVVGLRKLEDLSHEKQP